jgi:triosephosphate isomerase
MRPLIVGNWKMNGTLGLVAEQAERLAQAAERLALDLVVCPPFPLLAPFAARLPQASPLRLGGQDCHPAASGAHTGDVSAEMLREVGASFVILGHSERRTDHGETSALVRAKTEAARRAGLVPIVCVGENEAERAAGAAERVVADQLAASLPDGFEGVIAYEPVWAIGTGRTPTGEDIAAMHRLLRAALARRFGAARAAAIPLLYGGSVKPGNAAAILHTPEVDGVLVGGASLVSADFLAIAEAALPRRL